MSLVGYISSHFNRHRTLPPSLKAMRIIAISGIAVAAATLVVTLAILKGFEREYKRTILDFNAHIVLLKAGERIELDTVVPHIEGARMKGDDTAFIARHGPLTAVWKWLSGVFRSYAAWHERVLHGIPFDSFREKLLMYVAPARLRGLLPDRVDTWVERAGELSHKGVTGMTPFIYREGLLIAHGSITGAIVKGVDPATLADVNPMRIHVAPAYDGLDDALGAAGRPRVLLGSHLARELGVRFDAVGETVNILVPTMQLTKGENHFRSLEVAGIFESGLYDYDANFALMSIPAVYQLFGVEAGKLTGIELRLADAERADKVSAWIERQLGPRWRAVPWSELNAEIFQAVKMEKRTFSIIVGVLTIVAAFNIIGVLVLMIMVRMHEIALLRALGMSARALQRVFIRGGLIIGVIGVGAGLALGVAAAAALARFEIVHIAPQVYFLERLPIDISPTVCGLIAVFCVAVCWVTSLAAARKLTNIPMSEGLMRVH